MTITRPPDLSGAIWPIHPKLLEDELLSSWMVRIARGFHINPCVFWRRLVGPISFRTIDYKENDAVLRLLAEKTHTPFARTMQTRLDTFQSFGLLREQLDRHIVSFCPACLSDGIAYYRRRWCVDFMLICEHHDTVLLHGCPHCGALVRFEKIPLDTDSVAFCRKCQFDLRRSSTHVVQSHEVVALQQRLFVVLDRAFTHAPMPLDRSSEDGV